MPFCRVLIQLLCSTKENKSFGFGTEEINNKLKHNLYLKKKHVFSALSRRVAGNTGMSEYINEVMAQQKSMTGQNEQMDFNETHNFVSSSNQTTNSMSRV